MAALILRSRWRAPIYPWFGEPVTDMVHEPSVRNGGITPFPSWWRRNFGWRVTLQSGRILRFDYLWCVLLVRETS